MLGFDSDNAGFKELASNFKGVCAWFLAVFDILSPQEHLCMLNPWQNADYGGFLAKYGTIGSMDRALDKDINLGHEFLQSRHKLEQLKIENPGLRISAGSNMLKEQILATEQTKQGLRAPKKQFMELSVYRERHGEPSPGMVKTIVFRGKKLTGVDVQRREDVAKF